MSMISSQCDKLRDRASELRSLAPDSNVPYIVPSTKEIMALAMKSAALEMEDAANTIRELRDYLQQTNDQNAELRTQLADVTESMSRVEERCAKLRELAKDFMAFLEDDDACEHCGRDKECSEQGLVLAYEEDCLMRGVFRDRMRKLGVEVDRWQSSKSL